MKKFLIGAAAIMAVFAVSCNKNEGAQSTSENQFTDSLSTAFGHFVGASLAQQSTEYTAEQKQEFLNAFQQVMATASTEPAQRGALVASQMLQSMNQLGNDGIEMNRAAMVNGFKYTFLMDSVNYSVTMKYNEEFRGYHSRAMEMASAARAAERMAAPEAQQNGRIAADFVNRLKENDSAVATTESGLTYKIENAGEDAKPGANSTVKVKYIGKHINGEVFDQSGDEPATFNLRGVVPGFSEGLRLIGKGGKATLYIPGNLAYGAEGAPQAGIGPNEMLVFDVELVDFN